MSTDASDIARWLAARLAIDSRRSGDAASGARAPVRIQLSLLSTLGAAGAPLLDLPMEGWAVEELAADIEATARGLAGCLEAGAGARAFVLRCWSGNDVLGTKHFTLGDAGAPGPRRAQAAAADADAEAEQPRAGGGRATDLGERLGLLIPVVANAITSRLGMGPGPFQPPDVQRALLEALLRSMDDGQVQAIARALRPEQALAFVTLRERVLRGPPEADEPAVEDRAAEERRS